MTQAVAAVSRTPSRSRRRRRARAPRPLATCCGWPDSSRHARNAFAAAVALAPDNADALNKLAGQRAHRPRFDAARSHLRRALASLPRHPYAR
jgi:Flp pilus assembly protein TadD